MGLTPRGNTGGALWFGIGVHIALAEWYQKGTRRGPHPADTFDNWVGDEIEFISAAYAEGDREWYDEPKFIDARELGVAMLENYVETYGFDEQWDIISIETPFQVEVRNGGVPIAHFNSTWDGVLRNRKDGKIYLIDHKTASQISLAYLELDDQAGSYWAVASAVLHSRGTLKPGEEIAGIIYNFLRKSKPDLRERDEGGAYLNLDGTVSKKQPPAPFVRHVVYRGPAEQKIQMQRLADEVTVMNAMREGTIPVTKNTTRDCTWCEFFDMCQLHERGGDTWKEVARHDFVVSNPYERYQKSAGTE